jgi:hypothetical protein
MIVFRVQGLGGGHPVDQVKMLKKKIAVTLKKISKLPIWICSKVPD